MHDMVLDLICSLSSDENFISILDNVGWHAPNLQRKFRRLSLQNIRAKIHNHQFDSTVLSKVRTFAVFSTISCDWLPSLSSFQFLRVLDLGNCGSQKSSSGISLKYVCDLIHLRYLGLQDTNVNELPMDIGKLQLLQTLNTRRSNIKELPPSFVRLRNLICLHVDGGVSLLKGMSNLMSLEVLSGIQVPLSPHTVKELRHLTEVRELSFNCLEMEQDLINILIESLGNLHKLQELSIGYGGKLIGCMGESWVPPPHLREFISWDPYRDDLSWRLPKWINSTSLPHLSSLTIDVEELDGDDIQIIGMLPALQYLSLSATNAIGSLVVRADAFPSAISCRFNLFRTPICILLGAMPMVQHLEFPVCAWSIASGEVDSVLGHLPSLEHVEVMLIYENFSGMQKARREVINTAQAWLRCEAEAHPKCPTIVC
ncbi:hypothetical protein CFC21_096085 [Triticum aestivum]|uniref:Disease resistance R13L4/SHOC-2-like LRR domain-containing protein n=2 Tax=Triticum aestivum TaxID=4565 RepID=A0A3B6RDB4_WHEAT|nr:hypothetical protein CFC21_096085 [Triticum aestivum]